MFPRVVDQMKSWDNSFKKCWFTLNPVRMLSFELRTKSVSPTLSGRIGEEVTKKMQIEGELDSRKGKREENDRGNGEEKNNNAEM